MRTLGGPLALDLARLVASLGTAIPTATGVLHVLVADWVLVATTGRRRDLAFYNATALEHLCEQPTSVPKPRRGP